MTANKNCSGPSKHTHKEMWPVLRKHFKFLPFTEDDRASVEEKCIQKPNTSLILKNTELQHKHSYSSVCKSSVFYNI